MICWFTEKFGWKILKFFLNADNSQINNKIWITIDIFDTTLLGLGANCPAVWLGPLRLGRSDRLASSSLSKDIFLCRLSICLTRNILLSFYGTQIIVSHEHYGLRVFRSGSEPMTPVQADQANYHKIWAEYKTSVMISTLQLLFL